ncbi:MAG: hypothetical protein ACKVZH_22595 [Blastocatellia bacterium]
MRLIIRVITFGAIVVWALAAYARVEDPNINPDVIPPNEELWKWGLRVSTSLIYFMLKDFITLFVDALTKWHELSPERRFGTMLVTVLLITNVMYSLKDRGRRAMLRVTCPHDQTKAYPIPGSYNRYKCRNGHQFADDAHRF